MTELSKVAKDSAERIGTALGKKTGEAFHRFYNHTGDNLRTVSRNHDENDRNVRDSLHQAARTDEKAPKSPSPTSSSGGTHGKRPAPGGEKPGDVKRPKKTIGTKVKTSDGEELGEAYSKAQLRKHLGPTPVYRLKDNHTIERLSKDGAKPLTDEDKNRLGPLKLDGAKARITPEAREKYRLSASKANTKRPLTESEKIPFGSNELSRATQLARHEHQPESANKPGSYGTWTGREPNKTFDQSNNYAALRYGKRGDKDGFILVGNSSKQNSHSERHLGIPMLESGSAHRITALYTEREPCTGQGSPNCSAWMKEHMPSHVKVMHSAPYSTDRAVGNSHMEPYLNALRNQPH